MKLLFAALVMMLGCSILSAQVVKSKVEFERTEETTPGLVPAVSTDVWTVSVWVEEITLSNIGAVAVTCTVKDKQSTPRSVMEAVSVPANGAIVASFRSRWMPNGVTWSCSDGLSVVGYMRAKR